MHYDKQTEEVNNTYIKSPPGSWFLQMLLECIEKKIYGSDGVNWGEVGIHLFRETLGQHPEMMKYAQDAIAFCPVNYFNLSELICEGDFTPGEQPFAIHLWNEIWRRGHLDKNAAYHPGSIYERLKRTYLHSV